MKTRDSCYYPTVMIVDKDISNDNSVLDLLNNEDCLVQTAVGFIEILESFKKCIPDIIILDEKIIFDEGFGVISAIRDLAIDKSLSIIVVTENLNSEISEKTIHAGVDELLNKPFDSIELIARIKSVFSLKMYQEQLKIRKETLFDFSNNSQTNEDLYDSKAPLFKVLLVDNNSKNAKAIMDIFEYDDDLSFYLVDTGEKSITMALDSNFDLIIFDTLLPDMNALDAFKRIKRIDIYKQVPVIFVSATHDYNYRVICLEHEVDEFFFKPINPKVFNMKFKFLLKRKIKTDKLLTEYMIAFDYATRDGLTGLYKRNYFMKCLDLEIKKVKRTKMCLSVMMIDVDNFKIINDGVGHLEGDAILRDVGKVISNNIREVDVAARYGGEEFIILLLNTEKLYASIIAQRIQSALSDLSLPSKLLNSIDKLTVSVGIADYPYSSKSPIDLINKADQVLYQAKKTGKNKVCLYDDQLI
ncbi:MAG: diguanylate cyclase [Gammaproteobacteria bacterium]|nr:diguanylate cyclase [Gammaproteobacteria bacterium]